MKLLRSRSAAVVVLFVALAFVGRAVADAWDPPSGYYGSADGLSGATLKGQLTTIMSTGHILRSYGDFKEISPIVDRDPLNANNVLLVYTRASVQGEWSSGGTIWNREHTWPDSLQPGNASDSATGAIADPHMLRPCNPGVNSSRGNKPYGFENTTGANRAAPENTAYYFPGDKDKGDMARTMFYAATRWSAAPNNLKLTDSFPGSSQMGDLSSLIAWHFLDPPDEFERRRNHTVYSSQYNPLYSNNRNAYVDRPEYMWAAPMTDSNGDAIPNDSQITIDGGSNDGIGGSTRNINLGKVFVGATLPSAQTINLNKGGNNGTYFEVTTTDDASSSITGRYNAFKTNQPDSKSIMVGLKEDTSTGTAGLRSGSITVNNLEVTTGLAGHGAGDGNDVFNVSLNVLDHALPSFAASSTMPSLSYNFGDVVLGSVAPTHDFDLFNRTATSGFTASLDLDSAPGTGNTSVLTTNLSSAIGSLALAAGLTHTFTATLNTSALGTFAATYTLMLSDENITGALNSSLTLTLNGRIVTPILAGDYNDDDVVDAADYVIWRQSMTTGTALVNETASPGTVDDADYSAWRANFGATPSSSFAYAGVAPTSVPEPSTIAMVLIGCFAIQSARRTFRLA